jgi:hypothetical protein
MLYVNPVEPVAVTVMLPVFVGAQADAGVDEVEMVIDTEAQGSVTFGVVGVVSFLQLTNAIPPNKMAITAVNVLFMVFKILECFL